MTTLLRQLGTRIRKEMEFAQREFSELDWDDDLCGACGTASYLLWRELKRRGIKSEIRFAQHKDLYRGGHAWVETQDFLIDLTFTQFSLSAPKILLIRKSSSLYQKHLRQFQKTSKLPIRGFKEWQHQSPFFYLRLRQKELALTR